MLTSMKLLIGYDGSACSDDAIADLSRAGLPGRVEATMVSVAEVWPRMPASAYQPLDAAAAAGMAPAVRKAHALSAQALAEARESAAAGARRVRELFPGWTVHTEVRGDVPYRALVEVAEHLRPDLVVVGAHGRTDLRRMILGSVSQAVLTHAGCSVRLGRRGPGGDRAPGAPVKVAVGVDGSVDAAAAVSAVASRVWPAGSAALVLIAVDVPLSMALSGLGPPVGTLADDEDLDGHAWARRTAEAVEHELQDAGLAPVSIVRTGDPKRLLVEEARQWEADCIFVGAQGHSRLEKFLIGSVSAAVAARAHCSVEVVRQG
jgi:nucleotide-binding universal stress UspA family protein